MYTIVYFLLELKLPIVVVKEIQRCQPSDEEALEIVRRMVLNEFEGEDIAVGPRIDQSFLVTVTGYDVCFTVNRERNLFMWNYTIYRFNFSRGTFVVFDVKNYESMTLWMENLRGHVSMNWARAVKG